MLKEHIQQAFQENREPTNKEAQLFLKAAGDGLKQYGFKQLFHENINDMHDDWFDERWDLVNQNNNFFAVSWVKANSGHDVHTLTLLTNGQYGDGFGQLAYYGGAAVNLQVVISPDPDTRMKDNQVRLFTGGSAIFQVIRSPYPALNAHETWSKKDTLMEQMATYLASNASPYIAKRILPSRPASVPSLRQD